MRRLQQPSTAVGAAGLTVAFRGLMMNFRDVQSAGRHDLAPREDQDFEYNGQEIPGAHPLPLGNKTVRSLAHELVSPYMPSPHRAHPYFQEPLPELPHFDATVPIVYPYNTMRERIIVPVYNLKGEITHTRELDPYVFGFYPQNQVMWQAANYWQVRHQRYSSLWDYDRREIFRKAKKNWGNTGTGMGRVSDRKHAQYGWGGRVGASKPWTTKMPRIFPKDWERACRQTLTLKLLQGKLQIVSDLSLPEPTTGAFKELCDTMKWDVRQTGAGVLFMDGGSRLAPSREFNRSFFYGSFYNGRNKVVRPTITCGEQDDWNWKMQSLKWLGPKGPKAPIPMNRFNTFDAMEHHLCVLTEGAVMQLEQEVQHEKLRALPPHIRQQLPERGILGSHLLGDHAPPLMTIEDEAAARTEEREAAMYEPYYDNPYKPWADEGRAAYQVDAIDGVIRRTVDGKVGSWKILE